MKRRILLFSGIGKLIPGLARPAATQPSSSGSPEKRNPEAQGIVPAFRVKNRCRVEVADTDACYRDPDRQPKTNPECPLSTHTMRAGSR